MVSVPAVRAAEPGVEGGVVRGQCAGHDGEYSVLDVGVWESKWVGSGGADGGEEEGGGGKRVSDGSEGGGRLL